MKRAVLAMMVLGLAASCLWAADAASAPIKEVTGVSPQESAYDAATATKPVELKSEADAGKYFGKDELAKLTKEVDFTKQVVLVFAWKGSGGDKLDYTVAESAPEQIRFTYSPGRTRDLRPHVHIYVVRSDVKWSAK